MQEFNALALAWPTVVFEESFMSAHNRIKVILLVILVGAIGSLYFFVPGFYTKMFSMLAEGNIDELVEFIQSFGTWALLVAFLLDVLVNVLSVLPTIFLSAANGLIFGLPLGILISWLGECVGVIISFYVMRLFMYETAQKLISKSKRLGDIDSASGSEGLKFMTLARMLPYVPSGILTAVGAVSHMSVRDFVISTLVGKLPSTALEVMVGHDLVEFGAHSKRLGITATFILLVYLYLAYRRKKQKQAQEKTAVKHEEIK